MKRIILLLLVIISGFVFRIFYTTGYFRAIENQAFGKVYQNVPIAGVEDMAISREDSFLILSAYDRAGKRDGMDVQGALFFVDLTRDEFEPKILTTNLPLEFVPHGISLVKTDSDSYQVWVVNHPKGRHTIESFLLKDAQLVHVETLENPSINSPNDIVGIGEGKFYFTNDHRFVGGIKQMAEDYLGLSLSNVIFFDGSSFREVAGDIAYANGINYDSKRQLIYVASPRAFEVLVYQKEANGDLLLRNQIDAKTGVDNIELDTEGSLWIGCHPSLLAYASYAKNKTDIAPSEIIHIKIDEEYGYISTSVFVDDGSLISGTTVAIRHGPYLFLGNVMDDHFLILKK